MPTYILSYRHPSVSRAPELRLNCTLKHAKRVASRNWGDLFRDYELTIYEDCPGREPQHVASRLNAFRRWIWHEGPLRSLRSTPHGAGEHRARVRPRVCW